MLARAPLSTVSKASPTAGADVGIFLLPKTSRLCGDRQTRDGPDWGKSYLNVARAAICLISSTAEPSSHSTSIQSTDVQRSTCRKALLLSGAVHRGSASSLQELMETCVHVAI